MKFLVVDDSITMRRIIINALQRIGYNDVVEAADGTEALERLDQSIGFIITDWNMPNMSGVEFARAVRGTLVGSSLPILMVTTRAAREDIIAAMDAGVNNYILKPFTPSVLKEKIERLMSAARIAA
jgi:two-component system chemotaxis response regulator CheY